MKTSNRSGKPKTDLSRTSVKRGAMGVTLVELIVGISVLAVLVGLAAPSFSSVLAAWQRDNAIHHFMGDLQLARSTAIRTSRAVVMCVSANGVTCATGAGSDDWRQGRLVFSDLDSNGARDNGDPLIVQRGPVTGLQRMSSNITPGRLSFRTNGLLNSGNTTIEVLGSGANEQMRIRINTTGRASLLQSEALEQ
jgi:type IV fimbrial biogenesis protein FimT